MAPPSPATRPAFTWGSASRASSAMNVMSQKSAMVAPRPMASPLMAAMIGWGTASWARTIAADPIIRSGMPSG